MSNSRLDAGTTRTPLSVKLVASAATAYAFSAIDLIADFVLVLGLLDDRVLGPTGLWLELRRAPRC